jgi:hypothetical protein
MADDSKKIFSLIYQGRRFDNAHLPVEVLSDLPAFRDLLVAYAKEEWRRRHAGRKRIPRGFENSFSFDLVNILEGSAKPQLEWNRTSAQANLPGMDDEIGDIVECAYSNVITLIGGQAGVATALNAEKLRALNRFGAGLRENEKIEIPERRSFNVVYLDTNRRRQLITAGRGNYRTRFEGIGLLTGTHVKGDPGSLVKVFTDKYAEIDIPVEQDQIISDFDGSLYAEVQFQLLVELDAQDRFRSVVEVFDVGVVDNDDFKKCRTRLDELRNLKDGWHDGHGFQIAQAPLDLAQKFCIKHPTYCGLFRLYPTEVGGVLIDFERDGWDFSVEFSPTGGVEMYGIEIDGSQEMEPVEFPGLNDDFDAEFDRRVKSNG